MKDINPAHWQRMEALLDQVLEQPPTQRAAFLEQACPDDPDLQRQILDILKAGDAAQTFLEADSELGVLLQDLQTAQAEAEEEDRIGQRVGAYRLVRPLGRGGMGQVYLAVRDDEVFKHYVAIKIIRRGMDTEDILRRFRTERQILASLNHPNIARLLDGGLTDDGLSYLVMEYVDGLPINEYCDKKRLSINERLELFSQVCSAVHYAHQNLIVHRDLKPSNILVTADGTPKLLDFGIAKILNPNLAGYTLPITRTELRVMTPEYASPEQVRGETITTASDIYSLGVILYQLLTGHRPYRLTNHSAQEIAHVVCEQDPDSPSTMVTRTESITRVDGMTEEITPDRVSQARAMTTERLKRRLRGDLDTVVPKALRKEPDRRYASAEGFLEDIKRHLAGMPVSAQKDTVKYRTSKFVRRHKVEVVAVALVLVSLLVSIAVTVWQARVATQGWDQAQVEAAKAEEVKNFLIGLFEESTPETAQGEEATAGELLERGAAQVDSGLADQPAVQAEMQRVIGSVYRRRGEYEKAEPFLKRAVAQHRVLYGSDHPALAQSLHDLALLLDLRGVYGEAETLFREALAIRKQQLGDQHTDVAQILNDIGVVLARQDNYTEAEQLWREALAIQRENIGVENPSTGEMMSNLAIALHENGKFEEAEALMREALALQRKVVGEDHPNVAMNLYNLGTFMYDQQKYDEAEAYLREAMALRIKVLGRENPRTAFSMNWLGRVLHRKGNYDEAEELYQTSATINRSFLGENHPVVGRDLYTIATLKRDKGELEEAERLLLQAHAHLDRVLENKAHRFLTDTRRALAELYTTLGQPERAAAYQPQS